MSIHRTAKRAAALIAVAAIAYVGVGQTAGATGSISSTPSTFVAIAPVTVVSAKTLAAGDIVSAQVAGASTIPAEATSVQVNVKVSGGTTTGNLDVYATSDGTPSPSIYWVAGRAETAQLTVPVGNGGKISFKNITGSVALTATVTGYYQPESTIETYTFTPTNTDWLWNSQYVFDTGAGSYTEYFTRYVTYSIPDLTQDAIDDGDLHVSFTPSPITAPNSYVEVPYQFDSSFGYTYNVAYTASPGSVTLDFYFIQTDPTATIPVLSTYDIDTYPFKIVVTPGSAETAANTAVTPATARPATTNATCTAFPGGKRCTVSR